MNTISKITIGVIIAALSFQSLANIYDHIKSKQYENVIPLINDIDAKISKEWHDYGNNPHLKIMTCDIYEGNKNLLHSISSGKQTHVVIAPPDGENYSLRLNDIDIKEFDTFDRTDELFTLNKRLSDTHSIQMMIDANNMDYTVIERRDGKTTFLRSCKPEQVVELEKQRNEIISKLW